MNYIPNYVAAVSIAVFLIVSWMWRRTTKASDNSVLPKIIAAITPEKMRVNIGTTTYEIWDISREETVSLNPADSCAVWTFMCKWEDRLRIGISLRDFPYPDNRKWTAYESNITPEGLYRIGDDGQTEYQRAKFVVKFSAIHTENIKRLKQMGPTSCSPSSGTPLVMMPDGKYRKAEAGEKADCIVASNDVRQGDKFSRDGAEWIEVGNPSASSARKPHILSLFNQIPSSVPDSLVKNNLGWHQANQCQACHRFFDWSRFQEAIISGPSVLGRAVPRFCPHCGFDIIKKEARNAVKQYVNYLRLKAEGL